MKIVEIYKNTALIFNLLKAGFLLLCFAIYKMFDSKYDMDIYEYVKISIGTAIGNPKMVNLVPNHLKTK